MNKRYIEQLSQEQRATWGFQIFIRLWLSGMCRSLESQSWTISELAVIFEVTQAYLFADEPHTQSSLIKELGLTRQKVSRHVRRLARMGIIRQEEGEDDARRRYLYPEDDFFTRDAMERTAESFAQEWFHGWEQLDKAHNASWYFPMSKCRNKTALKEIDQFNALVEIS